MGIDNNTVKAELDALCSKYSTEASDKILRLEEDHYMAMTKWLGEDSYGRFKDQFRLFFQLSNEIALGLNYIDKKSWPLHRATQFLFIVNNLRSLHNATFNLLRGHWEDSMTIMRVNLEAMMRIIWISCYPDRVSAGVTKQKDGGREFNYTGFVKRELKLDWDDYKMMSMKAHGNQISVVQDTLELNNGTYKYPIMVRFKHDKVWFEVCLNYVIFIEVLYLEFLTEILVTETNAEYLSESLVQDAKRYIKLKKLSMKAHKKDYWPKVADEISDLMALVKACDAGEEFKTAWSKIKQK